MSLPPFNNPFSEGRLNTGTDFRPEWDVPELNRSISDNLAKLARAVKGRVQPDPGQMVQVLLGPPGYGKSHLFGRIGHHLDEEVLFVFVPAFEDISRPLQHIRSHVVESLFRERGGRPPVLHRALARLCQPSFIEYLSQFPPSLAARHQGLLQSLQSEPEAVLGMIQAVTSIVPFQRLAASIASRLPQVPFPVVNALALGWSPLADVARRWLRGDFLPKEELARLGLPEDAGPASPLEVLKGIAPLLRYQTPVILCCDQVELTFKHPEGPRQISAELIEILHQLPNVVMVLSCLQTEWPKFLDKSVMAFRQRVAKALTLNDLTEAQGVELVARRMRTWDGRQPQHAPAWPFDEPSVITYVRDRTHNPRILIQRCGELFKEWLEGDRKKPIYLTPPTDTLDPAKVFLQMWNAELETIAKNPAVAWSEYQEERLYRAVREMITLARDAGREIAGIRVRNVSEAALRQRGEMKRHALTVDLTVRGQDYRVLVPVTTVNNGRNFRFYFEDIEEALKGPVAGCLLVHRQTEFQRGGKSGDRFDEMLGKQLRLFTLEESPASHQRLECLLRFLDRAAGQELQIDSTTLEYKDCQDYILKTAVLDSLDLLKLLGTWQKAVPAQQAAGAAQAQGQAGPAAPVATTAPAAKPVSAPQATATVPTPPKANLETAGLGAAEHTGWAGEKLGVLVNKLKLWGLPVNPAGVEVGPSFARLKIEPAGSKTTFNKVRDKTTDLKIQLGLRVAPLIGSQPGYISVDVELPARQTVTLAETLARPRPGLDGRPAFPAGLDVAGQAFWIDLSDTSDCHLLVAGQTGSGKSEFLRAMVVAMARRFTPQQIQFVLIDPKQVSFNIGNQESPYLRFPVALSADKALPLLQWCLDETKKRYDLLAGQKKTNVGELEDASLIPRILTVVDEFANLLEDKKTKALLTSLLKQIGSMSRAAGIHLVLATQRPDKDVVTPLLRDNLPGRVALQVKTEASSKLVIDSPEAAYLLGKGDLLWQRGGSLLRLQSPFVTQAEFEESLKAH
ncbi:MAG TPA: FtsK/SpoIIIE domain-containing protein [Gemmataceae bacterium]|nr:FtsK/SpoIIIE domain-containing protein [Gemmataceae bacterium]